MNQDLKKSTHEQRTYGYSIRGERVYGEAYGEVYGVRYGRTSVVATLFRQRQENQSKICVQRLHEW